MHIITSTSFRIRIFVLLVIVFLSVGFVQAQWQYPNTNLIYYNASPGPGFVGIGTQTPASILEVVGSGCCNIANFRTTSSGNAWLQVGNSVGHMNVGFGSATPHAYLWSSTDSLFIGNDGAPTLFVQGMTNGNVGIGTTDTYGYK
ncbi:MAG TPA: hypothetical protein VK518_08875, partial [Puia sp.]|nr:hypothetical protein [Puia sp.]